MLCVDSVDLLVLLISSRLLILSVPQSILQNTLLALVCGGSSPLLALFAHPHPTLLPFAIFVQSDILQEASGTQHVLGMIFSAFARGIWQKPYQLVHYSEEQRVTHVWAVRDLLKAVDKSERSAQALCFSYLHSQCF